MTQSGLQYMARTFRCIDELVILQAGPGPCPDDETDYEDEAAFSGSSSWNRFCAEDAHERALERAAAHEESFWESCRLDFSKVRFANLRRLALKWSPLESMSFNTRNTPELTNLRIHDNQGHDAQALKLNLPELLYLKLERIILYTTTGFVKSLTTCTSLRSVDVELVRGHGSMRRVLQLELPSCQRLRLSRCGIRGVRITAPQLRSLDLTHNWSLAALQIEPRYGPPVFIDIQNSDLHSGEDLAVLQQHPRVGRARVLNATSASWLATWDPLPRGCQQPRNANVEGAGMDWEPAGWAQAPATAMSASWRYAVEYAEEFNRQADGAGSGEVNMPGPGQAGGRSANSIASEEYDQDGDGECQEEGEEEGEEDEGYEEGEAETTGLEAEEDAHEAGSEQEEEGEGEEEEEEDEGEEEEEGEENQQQPEQPAHNTPFTGGDVRLLTATRANGGVAGNVHLAPACAGLPHVMGALAVGPGAGPVGPGAGQLQVPPVLLVGAGAHTKPGPQQGQVPRALEPLHQLQLQQAIYAERQQQAQLQQALIQHIHIQRAQMEQGQLQQAQYAQLQCAHFQPAQHTPLQQAQVQHTHHAQLQQVQSQQLQQAQVQQLQQAQVQQTQLHPMQVHQMQQGPLQQMQMHQGPLQQMQMQQAQAPQAQLQQAQLQQASSLVRAANIAHPQQRSNGALATQEQGVQQRQPGHQPMEGAAADRSQQPQQQQERVNTASNPGEGQQQTQQLRAPSRALQEQQEQQQTTKARTAQHGERRTSATGRPAQALHTPPGEQVRAPGHQQPSGLSHPAAGSAPEEVPFSINEVTDSVMAGMLALKTADSMLAGLMALRRRNQASGDDNGAGGLAALLEPDRYTLGQAIALAHNARAHAQRLVDRMTALGSEGG